MKFSSVLAATGLLYGAAEAHGGVYSYVIGGQTYQGQGNGQTRAGSIQRPWRSIDPLLDMNANSLRCNTPGTASSATATAKIAAGSTIKANWQSWPHPHGPLVVWMAKCPGACSSFDGSGAVWFKIDEAGLLSGQLKGGNWGVTKMMNQGYSWTSTIPASLAPGEYIIRHELISVHDPGKPQFYPECAHLTVTGSGTAEPPASSKVAIPGVYRPDQASIMKINLYNAAEYTKTTWDPIGPQVWRG